MVAPPKELETLPETFFNNDTRSVAKNLLGKKVARVSNDHLLTGEIVETEAYYGKGDPSSHASRGKTKRNKIMWEKGGICYIYLVYGIHYMLNVTTEDKGKPGAVLIRALRPIRGIEYMKQQRQIDDEAKLTNGPGKLTKALNVEIDLNHTDLTEGKELWLAKGKSYQREHIGVSGRIGVDEKKPPKLRFFVKGDPFLSR